MRQIIIDYQVLQAWTNSNRKSDNQELTKLDNLILSHGCKTALLHTRDKRKGMLKLPDSCHQSL